MPPSLRHGLANRCDRHYGIGLVQAFDGIQPAAEKSPVGIVHKCKAAKPIL